MNQKNDYIWNTIAGLINAAEAVVMSMIVTRITGLQDAGIITISFAIGNLMMTIGKFGVRNYQVTDVRKKYSFSDYMALRIFTVLLMLLISGGYLIWNVNANVYSFEKALAIGTIIFIYAVESIEDVVWGQCQLEGYLAKGAKLFCFRWLGILSVFFICMLIWKNMLVALIVSAVVSVIIFCFCLKLLTSEVDITWSSFGNSEIHFDKIWRLICTVFPLFIVSFLVFYVNNAPKYAIDGLMSEEVQACYGFVAMPVFVIGLLNNFIYQPTLVNLAEKWNLGQYDKVEEKVKRQIGILLGMTIVILIGAYLIGIPVLSIVYATDLHGYKTELMVLLVGGAFLALSGYFNVILTIMRCQKELLLGYVFIALAAFLMLDECVAVAGTVGVSVGYAGLMMVLAIVYGVIVFVRIEKGTKGWVQY